MKRARALFASSSESDALSLRMSAPNDVTAVRDDDDAEDDEESRSDHKYLKPGKRTLAEKQSRGERTAMCYAGCVVFGVFLMACFVIAVSYTLNSVRRRITQHAFVDIVGQHVLRTSLAQPKGAHVQPKCHPFPHADAWGSLAPGAKPGNQNIQESADACCDSCASSAGCAVWVWNDVTHECWLKAQPNNKNPERPHIYIQGKDSPWTTGAVYPDPGYDTYVSEPDAETCVHVVVTSNGGAATAYSNWQTKIMYASFLQARGDAGERGKLMKYFTRLLHRTTDDELSTSIPTFRVDPRRSACDTSCDFVVGDRADAFVKFLEHPRASVCSHLLIAETDYVFVDVPDPLSLPAHDVFVGFSYGYVAPEYKDVVDLSKRFYAGDLSDVPSTGPAPGLVTVSTFRKLATQWKTVQQQIDDDPDAVRAYGWVRDMYSFSFAAAQTGVRAFLPSVPYNPLVVQIPADDTLGKAIIIHFTWGPRISVNDTVVWHYDKRAVDGSNLRPIADLPPFSPLMRLQANETVTHGVYDLLRLFQKTYNRALMERS